MKPLDKATLLEILTTPKNALIKQYIHLFDMDGIKLQFTSGALNYIVEKSMQYKLGARGLRSLCEAVLNDAMFELPDSDVKELKVTKQYADQKLSKIELPKLKVVS
jgi:ATP-dependent Clp protease ATP-binding subunit ClpX